MLQETCGARTYHVFWISSSCVHKYGHRHLPGQSALLRHAQTKKSPDHLTTLLLKLHRATVDLIRSISQGSHALFTIRDLQFYTDACGALPRVTLKIETSSLSSKLRWEEALAAAGQAPLVHPELRRCQTWSRQQQTI